MSERLPKLECPQPEIVKQENELGPEVIETVMGKIEDIRVPGTAFHVLNANRYQKNKKEETLGHMLRDGILGLTRERVSEEQRAAGEKRPPSHTQRGAYIEDLKSGKLPTVFFDIVGRNTDQDGFWLGHASGKIAIIFDLSHFVDGIGQQQDFERQLDTLRENRSTNPWKDYLKEHVKIGKYFPTDGTFPNKPFGWTKDGKSIGQIDMGHQLFGRVSPRHFKGIILEPPSDTAVQDEMIRKIVEIQLNVYKLQPEKLLPIYNRAGDLLWPKQLRHEKIIEENEEK